MGGSGRDTAPQGETFRPEATSHPPALDAQHLLCLKEKYTTISPFYSTFLGAGRMMKSARPMMSPMDIGPKLRLSSLPWGMRLSPSTK